METGSFYNPNGNGNIQVYNQSTSIEELIAKNGEQYKEVRIAYANAGQFYVVNLLYRKLEEYKKIMAIAKYNSPNNISFYDFNSSNHMFCIKSDNENPIFLENLPQYSISNADPLFENAIIVECSPLQAYNHTFNSTDGNTESGKDKQI